MKAYILSIAGVVLLSALISLFAPQGKLNQMIKGVTRLACLTVLIAPFASLSETLYLPEDIQPQEEYVSACIQLAEEQETLYITQQLQVRFQADCEVSVTCEEKSPFSVKKIQVNVLHSGINSDTQHINMLEKIHTWLKAVYPCDMEVFCVECNQAATPQ